LIPPHDDSSSALPSGEWYLGIDIGATHLSATLLDKQTEQQYPLYWVDRRKSTNQESYKLSLEVDWLEKSINGSGITPGLLHRFKPYLNVTIPFISPQNQQWEPRIRQSETQTVPLIHIQEALVALLSTLHPASPSPLQSQAKGLSSDMLRLAMTQLSGVIVNQPVGSSDAYRFNLREVILKAGFVTDPARIFFLEEAIAALLPELHTATDSDFSTGAILVVSAGTSATELALTTLTNGLQAVSRSNIYLRRVPYAGNALDQDVICQLLLPTAKGWESLHLQTLNLPLPGEPDLEARYQLQQRLDSVPLGQQLLAAVRQIKPLLCQQDTTLEWEGNRWQLRHQDFKSWIMAPYLQQLNREVNSLLSQLGLSADRVETVICTGGSLAIGTIAQWLQYKFPKATLIHDSDSHRASHDDIEPSRHQRIASGLALLPLFPAVLDSVRHQYSEYYLLRIILKTLSVQTEHLISSAHLQSLLEKQHVPANACQPFVTNLLEGQLPPGLVITKASAMLLSSESIHSSDYQELAAASLFSRQGNQVYRVSRQQRDRLWNHLQIILANTHQTLEQPLAVTLADVNKQV